MFFSQYKLLGTLPPTTVYASWSTSDLWSDEEGMGFPFEGRRGVRTIVSFVQGLYPGARTGNLCPRSGSRLVWIKSSNLNDPGRRSRPSYSSTVGGVMRATSRPSLFENKFTQPCTLLFLWFTCLKRVQMSFPREPESDILVGDRGLRDLTPF